MEEVKYIRGFLSNVSRKDLRNLASYFKEFMTRKTRDKVERNHLSLSKRLDNLIKNQEPISLKDHKAGAAHKPGLGPGRTPIKCYNYLKTLLKIEKQRFEQLKSWKLSRILVTSSTNKLPGGYVKAARGSLTPKQRRRYGLTFEFINKPTTSS